MKRGIIIEKLMKEGLSSNTLASMTDKQLNLLSERMTAKMSDIRKSPDLLKLAKDPNNVVQVTGEEEVSESLKGNKKKCDGKEIILGSKKETTESKPSAGLSKKKKSEIVKKAKKGEDIGKKGKGFQKVVQKAKKSGAKNPQAVAAAAMWKNIARESEVKESSSKSASDPFTKSPKTVKESIRNTNKTTKGEILDLIKKKLNEGRIPDFMKYDSIKLAGENPETLPSEPDIETIPDDVPNPDTTKKPRTPYNPWPGKDPNPKAKTPKKKEILAPKIAAENKK